MNFDRDTYFNFEMVVHVIEVFVVFIIGYTVYLTKKFKKDEDKRRTKKQLPSE
ncbi:MAG: hypothetical protein ACPGJV_01155 [Bacteriovoracaceae bacterium]